MIVKYLLKIIKYELNTCNYVTQYGIISYRQGETNMNINGKLKNERMDVLYFIEDDVIEVNGWFVDINAARDGFVAVHNIAVENNYNIAKDNLDFFEQVIFGNDDIPVV